eukprot:gene40338-53315_t
MYPAIDPLQEVLGQLMQVQLDYAKAEYDSAAASFQTILALALTAVVLGVLLAVLMGGAMIRQISRSLDNAVQITDSVAQGDLTVPIHVVSVFRLGGDGSHVGSSSGGTGMLRLQ